ncbi:transglycosylase family protein [Streptomyces sp. NPDC048629]|uniref:transglycosylase family protein n=1 Tax=Streptomyces sp. NPDC048629 TaxID=3154824 RepID=UPI0034395B3F
MTGSALALPLLGAGSASAADAATWNRVAECESGGLWSADFGNGLYGGLQFTQETWDTFGGAEYAARPDLASRAQQIAVAEKALASHGAKTWATCAGIVGLKDDGTLKPPANPTGGVLPEAPDASANPDAAGEGSTDPAESDTPGKPEKSAEPDVSGSPSSPSASASPDAGTSPGTETPGTGKHRGEAATEDPVNSDTTPESGRHAAPSGDPARDAGDPAVDEIAGNQTDAAKGVKGENPDTSDEYTVLPGDNLSEIAAEHELHGGWKALYKANRETVGADPDLIRPGQSLDLTDRQ